MTYAVNGFLPQTSIVPVRDPYHSHAVRIVRLLRQERERQGLSKYAVEQRTGVTQQMVGYVERGLRKPSLEIALRMAGALNVNLGEIIKRAGESPKE